MNKITFKNKIYEIIYNKIRPYVGGNDTCDITTECTEEIYKIVQTLIQDIINNSILALTNFNIINNDSDILSDILFDTLLNNNYIDKCCLNKDDCKKMIQDIQAEYIIKGAETFIDDIKI